MLNIKNNNLSSIVPIAEKICENTMITWDNIETTFFNELWNFVFKDFYLSVYKYPLLDKNICTLDPQKNNYPQIIIKYEKTNNTFNFELHLNNEQSVSEISNFINNEDIKILLEECISNESDSILKLKIKTRKNANTFLSKLMLIQLP